MRDELRAEPCLVAVHFASHQSQCYVGMPWSGLKGRDWRLADRMGPDVYNRPGDNPAARGLYFDLPAWGYHAFGGRRLPGGAERMNGSEEVTT